MDDPINAIDPNELFATTAATLALPPLEPIGIAIGIGLLGKAAYDYWRNRPEQADKPEGASEDANMYSKKNKIGKASKRTEKLENKFNTTIKEANNGNQPEIEKETALTLMARNTAGSLKDLLRTNIETAFHGLFRRKE